MLNIKKNISKNPLALKRTAFIAACLDGNYLKASGICSDIYTCLLSEEAVSENEQKAVNQVLVFIKKFQLHTINNEISVIKKKISNKMASIVRKETRQVSGTDFKTWLQKTGLNATQLKILLQTANILQLSTGCSNYCRRCNEWALPGVRKHFTFDAVKQFTTALFSAGNRDFIYYGASDPLDWEDDDADLSDIYKYLQENNYIPTYGVLTKLPAGKGKTLAQLIKINADIAVSVTNQNRYRIDSFESTANTSLNKQHDSEDLLIPAGLDEDFNSVKASITDSYGSEISPDGAFLIIPAFTSILNLTGQHRIQVGKDTNYFIERKTGRNALPVDYFKPFEAVDLEGRRFRLKGLLSVQIENIMLDSGDESLTPPGMMSLEEFFTTFEEKAVLKRKSIIPSIIKQYKKEIPDQTDYKKASTKCRLQFRNKLSKYLVLCSIKKMMDIKKSTISYLLSDVSEYLKLNPEKAIIITHLTTKEREKLYNKYAPLFSDSRIETMIDKNKEATFTVFKILVQRLLDNPDDISIHQFISTFPSYYDEASDMYLRLWK